MTTNQNFISIHTLKLEPIMIDQGPFYEIQHSRNKNIFEASRGFLQTPNSYFSERKNIVKL